MSGRFRTPSGGRVDWRRPVHFTFDGKSYQGLPRHTARRCSPRRAPRRPSFKYHRPRGIVTAGSTNPINWSGLAPMKRITRRTCARRRSGIMKAGRGKPETAGRRWASMSARQRGVRAVPDCGVLLQDLYVAARRWKKIYETADPPRGRPRARAEKAGHDRYTQVYAHATC